MINGDLTSIFSFNFDYSDEFAITQTNLSSESCRFSLFSNLKLNRTTIEAVCVMEPIKHNKSFSIFRWFLSWLNWTGITSSGTMLRTAEKRILSC